MKVEMWKVDEIKTYENNPRVNDQAVKSVARQVETFGFDPFAYG